MKFLFNDGSFSFETLRGLSYLNSGGADIGEMVVAAANIPDGDENAWTHQLEYLADRIYQQGESAAAGGHKVSTREAYLRASNYYRMADFYYRTDPDADQERSQGLNRSSEKAFNQALPLLEYPGRAVKIPYEDTFLPGYYFTPDDSGKKRPTFLYIGGYDSTAEELYFAGGTAALKRGYNLLIWDGPGQGSNVRDRKMYFRPDYEAAVTPAVDFALSLPEVDGDRLALMGMSLGGYLAPRAAAFEKRISALIAYDGVWSLGDSLDGLIAPAKNLGGGLEELLAQDTFARWALRTGVWSFGVKTYDELLEAAKAYNIGDVVDQITCDVLVEDTESDQFFKGQAQHLYDSLSNAKSKEFIQFYDNEGAGEHCSEGALLTMAQRTFDWLDEKFDVKQ